MDGCKRTAFVDLQGFTVNKQFVLKELCFYIAPTSSPQSEITPKYHYIYKPPFSWKFVNDSCKRSIIWLIAFHHGLYWMDGNVSYGEIGKTIEPLRSPNLILYVKGAQKVSWLKNILNDNQIDCRNIEDIGCNLQLNESASCRLNCGQHKHKAKSCALQSVKLLESWYFTFY